MTDETVDFRPEDFSRYVDSEVGQYARIRPNDRDDLTQEGLIAAWKAADSFDPSKGAAFRSWVTRSIDYALLEAHVRKKWTGMPPRNKQGGGSSSREDLVLVGNWHSSDDTESDASLPKNLHAEDHSGRADWAYHQVEIMKAIARLKPDQQRYVVLRFWCGYRGNELKSFFPHIKQPDVTLWHNPSGARVQLRESLSHLVSR